MEGAEVIPARRAASGNVKSLAALSKYSSAAAPMPYAVEP
jgi:hypothetical protein